MEIVPLVLTLGSFLAALLFWAFKRLPEDSWQFIASVPLRRNEAGGWKGLNLTFYGFFIAGASAFGAAAGLFLLGSVSVNSWVSVWITAALLGICIPASKVVAGLVEKTRYTFSVGGALFVGVLIMPWVIRLVGTVSGRQQEIQVIPVCAAMAIAYGFGEGLGRLACISFGCCYGKPLTRVHPRLLRFFEKRSFVFAGETKKVTYAGGLEGEKLVPIQALTSTVYCAAALVGCYLFLSGRFGAALLQVLIVTQLWRIFSELLRDDYRGRGRFSAYQVMMSITLMYSLFLPSLFPMTENVPVSLVEGWHALWSPWTILILQVLWFVTFFYYGKSRVTDSDIVFHVVRERVRWPPR